MEGLNLIFDVPTMVYIIVGTITITKALTQRFLIKGEVYKVATTIAVYMLLFFAFLFKDVYIVSFLTTVLGGLLASMGVYDLLPAQLKEALKNTIEGTDDLATMDYEIENEVTTKIEVEEIEKKVEKEVV